MSAQDQASDETTSRALAIVLGTNDVASAMAVRLYQAGWAVVAADRLDAPAARRGMAFHDALFGDPIELDGVGPVPAETTLAVMDGLARRAGVVVTPLGFSDLVHLGPVQLLVDARLEFFAAKPHLRCLARLTVGVGAGFIADENCDFAVGVARSESDGRLQRRQAHCAGAWRTPLQLGAHVFRNLLIGRLDGDPIHAPADGVVTALVRDGTKVLPGVDLFEIEPRVREACWTGLSERGRSAAAALVEELAARALQAQTQAQTQTQAAPGASDEAHVANPTRVRK
jgi:hypothetical protein